MITFTRSWFENKLKVDFNIHGLDFIKYKEYPIYSQRRKLCERLSQSRVHPPFNDVDIVFLAGGTCRIPFIQKKIKEMFPKAEVKIEEELEAITATGAAIHALQILNEEIEPCIKIIEQGNDTSHEVEQENSKVEPSSQLSNEKEIRC